MTIVRGSDLGDMMRSESVRLVSADVSFVSDRFPSYLIGANDRILDPQEDPPEVPSIKEIVAQESAQLVEQQKRLSVRDLASKFEKGLAAAAKLSDEAKFREAASLEGQVLLKKLRDVLEWLRGRVSGRNKDDVEDAIAMVEALAVQLTHREGELLQEKTEVKKLASFLKQASEDAKKVAERARAFAQAEVGSARAAVKKIEQAMQEQENVSRNSDRQNTENLMQEVQEARRIKVLHQPTKVMGMEYEVQALRVQLAEKSMYALQLWKELEMSKRVEEKKADLYELDGSESLGSYLWIVPCTDSAPDISQCTIQWFRKSYEGSKREMISGAIKTIYAPEPFDVGRFLQVEIVSEDQRVTVTTTGPIDPAAGLGNYVETLLRKADSEFNVSVIQMNGHDRLSHSVHVFHVGKKRIKLRKGRFSKAKEPYSASMQLCGVRGSGNAAARALFWQVKKGLSFTLAFESERERNAAIMLARRFALDCNIMLAGPGDYAPPRTH